MNKEPFEPNEPFNLVLGVNEHFAPFQAAFKNISTTWREILR